MSSSVLSLVVALSAATSTVPATATEFVGNRMFVASVGADKILEIDDAGALRSSFTATTLDGPRGVAFSGDGKFYTTSGDRVLRFSATGQLEATLGAAAGLEKPRGIAIGPLGHIFVTSTNRVIEMDRAGTLVREIGKYDDMGVPAALCFGANDHLYVAVAGTNSIAEFDAGFRKLGNLAPSGLAIPIGMTCGPDGLLYVASFFSGSVLALDDTGAVVTTFADPALLFPSGVAIGPNGNLFVTTFFGQSIVEFTLDGSKVREIALPADAPYPEGIAFSPFRFAGKIEGKLAVANGKPKNVSVKAICSYAPGSRTLQLELEDSANQNDLASVLETPSMVFHGFEAYEHPTAKNRLVQAAETVLGSDGQGSFHLSVVGKAIPFGFASAFQPKSLSGKLSYAIPGAVFRGDFAAKKILE